MPSSPLHAAATAGDLEALRGALAAATRDAGALEARDEGGHTPLMCAVTSAQSPTALTIALLDAGAQVNAVAASPLGFIRSALSLALATGDPSKVEALLDAGADLHYDRDGYGAMLDALHERWISADARLLDLIHLLIARGARLDNITPYHESALRVLSRVGRFDAIALLLQAGADESQLGWTPLIRTVALDTVAALSDALTTGAALEERDYWSRTAWLVAVLSGDVGKAALLREHGANLHATGRCREPTLFYAVASRSEPMLRYVLDMGAQVDLTNEFGETALMEAAERGDALMVDRLLDAGAAVDFDKDWSSPADAGISPEIAQRLMEARGETALKQSQDPAVIRRLLQAGADPQHLSFEGRRALLGLPAEPDVRLLTDDPAQFQRAPGRRFGTRNPERMDEPFWLSMIRSGVTGYHAAQRFGRVRDRPVVPIWCAQRFGQSLTLLPDGRVVQVAGEHEDSYDPDFCIYNDVFVHAPDGSIAIYGYPAKVFPPTDFHTATLIDETIYLIGSLGYPEARQAGVTAVFALDTRTFRIQRLKTTGESPGWIYRHRARLRGAQEIVVSDGRRFDGSERDQHNEATAVLDVRTLQWRRED